MREEVCIILNEREPAKAKAAETLAHKLTQIGITSSRLPVTPKLEQVVVERAPKVLVLDYLLGDFTTGLDILSHLKIQSAPLPKTFFLTDETSIAVAIAAMRAGALHYFELDNPQSVVTLARSIQEQLEGGVPNSAAAEGVVMLEHLLGQTTWGQSAITQLKTSLTQRDALIVLHGPSGCGKRTIARALQNEFRACLLAEDRPLCREIDAAATLSTFTELLGVGSGSHNFSLGKNLTATILHAEEDQGELLALFDNTRAAQWRKGPCPFLVICTSDSGCAKAWKKLFDGVILEIPALAERAADMVVMVPQFIREAARALDAKLKPFEPALIKWLMTLPWPGDLGQLKAVTISSALQHASTGETLQTIIEQQRALWEESHAEELSAASQTISPIVAARALEISGNNLRIAAARLGVSVPKLRNALDEFSDSKGHTL